jgi:phage terminase large subunit
VSASIRRLDERIQDLIESHGGARTPEDFSVYKDRPVEFMREVLRFEPWDKQIEVAQSVVSNKRTAVRGAHAMGKDAILGPLMLWAAYARGMLVLAISATEKQLLGQLWKELSNRFVGAGDRLHGQLFTGDLRIGGEKRILTMTSGSISNLTGWHDPNGVFVCISEAQGEQTEAASFDAAETNATDDASRIIVGGNPYKAEGRFFDIHSRSSWNKIKISAFDHPNITTGQIVIPGGPSPSWPAEMEAEYGLESAFYVGRVLAEFPTVGSIDALVEREWVERANELWTTGKLAEEANRYRPRLVADIARTGFDSNCIAVVRGPVVQSLQAFTERDLMKTAKRLYTQSLELGFNYTGSTRPTPDHVHAARARVTVDDNGLGGGVTDRLRELGARVTAFNGATKADDKERYANRRAESYFKLRDKLMRGRMALPPNEKLREELLAICYTTDAQGRILIEGKDILRSKLRRSPDHADPVSMSCEADRSARNFQWQLTY